MKYYFIWAKLYEKVCQKYEYAFSVKFNTKNVVEVANICVLSGFKNTKCLTLGLNTYQYKSLFEILSLNLIHWI